MPIEVATTLGHKEDMSLSFVSWPNKTQCHIEPLWILKPGCFESDLWSMLLDLGAWAIAGSAQVAVTFCVLLHFLLRFPRLNVMEEDVDGVMESP